MPATQKDAPFFQVARRRAETSLGEVELPILYYDVSTFYAYFLVDHAAATRMLEGTKLVAARALGNKALVGLAFYEYRDTSIGPYNEVGTALAVFREASPRPAFPLLQLLRGAGQRALGFYILDLPVSTDVACVAGREIWGYPKFVTELPMTFAGRHFEGRVLDPGGGEICRLSGRRDLGLKLPGFDLVLYSERKGQPLRTVVDVNAWFATARGGSLQLSVGAAAHPMAQNLRDLGLAGARAFSVQSSTTFQSRLHGGREI